MTCHPVRVRKLEFAWAVSCENREFYEETFQGAIADAQEHASHGDGEDRWCPTCEKYKPTCDDLCLDCGTDT